MVSTRQFSHPNTLAKRYALSRINLQAFGNGVKVVDLDELGEGDTEDGGPTYEQLIEETERGWTKWKQPGPISRAPTVEVPYEESDGGRNFATLAAPIPGAWTSDDEDDVDDEFYEADEFKHADISDDGLGMSTPVRDMSRGGGCSPTLRRRLTNQIGANFQHKRRQQTDSIIVAMDSQGGIVKIDDESDEGPKYEPLTRPQPVSDMADSREASAQARSIDEVRGDVRGARLKKTYPISNFRDIGGSSWTRKGGSDDKDEDGTECELHEQKAALEPYG